MFAERHEQQDESEYFRKTQSDSDESVLITSKNMKKDIFRQDAERSEMISTSQRSNV